MKNISVSLVVLLLAACASTPNAKNAPVSDSSKANRDSSISSPAMGASNNADIESRGLAAEKVAAEARALHNQSVFFDFDKSELKPEYRDVIQQQATFLNAHRNDVVTVEGNCDERGSDEYNLSLGERRANTALKNLELLGVLPNQIKSVSFGSQKQRSTCHEENCWKENRRDDFAHNIN